MGALLVLLSFFGSFAIIFFLPAWFRRAHVAAQNALLERCRALFILGETAVRSGDKATARNLLMRIRRLEARWRFGNSPIYRAAKMISAVALGMVGYIFIRYGGLYLYTASNSSNPSGPQTLLPDQIIYLLVAGAALQGVLSYYGEWVNPWAIEDCGDRLQRLLDAGVSIEVIPQRARKSPRANGITPREIFGLGPTFTRSELDEARRRLAKELHPDRWHGAEASARHNAEEALKTVNAAYDAIRANAR
jgi:hypothetical protein